MSGDVEVHRRSRRDLVSKGWKYLSAERVQLGGLAVLAVIAAQAESVALVLVALIAEAAARGSDAAHLTIGALDLGFSVVVAAGLAIVAICVAGWLVFTNGHVSARIFARLEREARDEIAGSYAQAEWEYQSTQKSSRVQGRILRLMDARASAFMGMVGWLRALATIVVFVAVAAVMSPLAAGVIVIFGVLLSLVVLPIRKRIVRIATQAAEAEVGLVADVAEAAEHGADVHVFDAWRPFMGRFAAKSGALQAVRARLGSTKNLMSVVYQYGALGLILAIMLIATSVNSEGEIGAIAASALLLLRTVQYGQQLQHSLQQLAESIPKIELLYRELVVPPPRVVPGRRILVGVQRVQLQGVSYQYPGESGLALDGVSVDLRAGTIVGIAGPSGSGKSTLAQILLRLRWPTSGRHLVNGLSAAEYSSESWCQQVSYVPQDPHLLHGSLAENVSFLDDSVSDSQIDEALASVGLDQVKDVVGGLQAALGRTGRSLSGGQVQRLGIARALVREPRLIVLDEPTSALDVNSERVVGDALAALRGRSDVLVVIIAHRASTLALCDEIVVLDDGHVVAAGRAKEVAVDSEFLARTWDAATSGPGRASR